MIVVCEAIPELCPKMLMLRMLEGESCREAIISVDSPHS
jgi:hypothetical protein